MKYEVVVIPESFHPFGKHNMEHICVPMVIEGRSYNVAMEVLNGIDKAIMSKFNVTFEEVKGDDCDIVYRKYELNKDGKTGIVHVKLRKVTGECGKANGNRIEVFEFERDIQSIIEEIENCLS
ncbi:hypothetical protein [Thermococcus gorgonarius]|uniref:Uncharacterized protein n=1 Tax=Thermococcus gorgonarius TaxID=71997 RepID=A0A2Z2M720_THEGO|nr:hypothetical protein [Thermococcus gorgonarius]ASJ00155.1 hypothetical protein A3K92_00960 [Thermococcus gorgonarius]